MHITPGSRSLAAALLALAWIVAATAQESDARPDDGGAAVEEKVTATYDKVVVERETRVRQVETLIKRKIKPVYVAAIFVKNRAERVPDQKVLVVQDFMTGHLNGKGFRVIAREDAINKVADFATEGPNRGDKHAAGEKLDELLSNNTSALRLAENLGADYVLNVAVTQYGRDAVRYRAEDIDHTTVLHKLKLTYTLLDTTVGGAMTSGIATATFTERFQPGTEIVRENTVDDLLDAAAQDLSKMLETAARSDAITSPEAQAAAKKEVNFSIMCAVADLTVPEVVKDEQGHYVVRSHSLKVEPLAFTVELDGTVIGSTDAVQRDQHGNTVGRPVFSARPGLHKMRIRRELFKDWEGTVNIREGLGLTVAMVMTKDGLDQFLGLGREFNQWKKDQVLSELQAKMYEDYMKRLSDCRLRVIGREPPPGPPGSRVADEGVVDVRVKVRREGAGAEPQNEASRNDPPSESDKSKEKGEQPPVDPEILPRAH